MYTCDVSQFRSLASCRGVYQLRANKQVHPLAQKLKRGIIENDIVPYDRYCASGKLAKCCGLDTMRADRVELFLLEIAPVEEWVIVQAMNNDGRFEEADEYTLELAKKSGKINLVNDNSSTVKIPDVSGVEREPRPVGEGQSSEHQLLGRPGAVLRSLTRKLADATLR